MLESDVGFSVSFTRQCCGIGSGAGAPPALPPRPAPAALPAVAAGGFAAGGGGGGVKTPAGTTSADITIVCGVDIVRIASQFVDVPAASNNASASMTLLLTAALKGPLYNCHPKGPLYCV